MIIETVLAKTGRRFKTRQLCYTKNIENVLNKARHDRPLTNNCDIVAFSHKNFETIPIIYSIADPNESESFAWHTTFGKIRVKFSKNVDYKFSKLKKKIGEVPVPKQNMSLSKKEKWLRKYEEHFRQYYGNPALSITRKHRIILDSPSKFGNIYYIVDGYIKIGGKKFIFEFDDDAMCGNPDLYATLAINPFTKFVYGHHWRKKTVRRTKLRDMGYRLYCVWESEYDKGRMQNEKPVKFDEDVVEY